MPGDDEPEIPDPEDLAKDLAPDALEPDEVLDVEEAADVDELADVEHIEDGERS